MLKKLENFLLDSVLIFTNYKISILNKVYLLVLSIVFFTTSCILTPIMIFTEGYHINCNSQGSCSYYKTFLNKKPKQQVDFNLSERNNNIFCKVKKQDNKTNYYRLIINNNDEIPKAPNIIPYKKCELFRSEISNILNTNDKTLNFSYYPNSIVFKDLKFDEWLGVICWLFMILFSCWLVYLTYKVYTSKPRENETIKDILRL